MTPLGRRITIGASACASSLMGEAKVPAAAAGLANVAASVGRERPPDTPGTEPGGRECFPRPPAPLPFPPPRPFPLAALPLPEPPTPGLGLAFFAGGVGRGIGAGAGARSTTVESGVDLVLGANFIPAESQENRTYEMMSSTNGPTSAAGRGSLGATDRRESFNFKSCAHRHEESGKKARRRKTSEIQLRKRTLDTPPGFQGADILSRNLNRR